MIPELSQILAREAKGKIVESLEWDSVGEYWVMTFTNGGEITFRFMAELIQERSKS